MRMPKLPLTSSRCTSHAAAKWILDRLVAASALAVLSPLLAIVALSIRLAAPGSVLFRQTRIGFEGNPFEMVKFRTMTNACGDSGQMLPDGNRLTRIGCLMRRTSIDELPQLWNVLKGDMYLVGPRPLLPEYLPRYDDVQCRRHEVKPGMTGWAQVNGRNALSWEQKFELDVWYVDHQGFWLDVKILWLTVLQVLRRDGISQAGHATMPEFVGSPALRTRAK